MIQGLTQTAVFTERVTRTVELAGRPLKRRAVQVILVLLIAAFKACVGAEAVETQTSPEPVGLDANNFARWTRDALAANIKSKSSPQAVADTLILRLRSGRPTAQETFVAVANEWTRYDATLAETPQVAIKDRKFLGTLKFLEMVKPFSESNPYLQSKLLSLRGAVKELQRDYKGAAEDKGAAFEIIDSLRTEIDLARVDIALGAAVDFREAGNVPKAQELYNVCLDYPWWKIRDPEPNRLLKSSYITAARGLIVLFGKNPTELKKLEFVGFVKNMLEPELQEAINRAGG